MRSVIWVILLFVAAVVSAAVLSQNDGLVSIFYSGWRIDTSLNVAVVALVLFVIVLYVALKAINGLLSMPRRAHEWRELKQAVRVTAIEHPEAALMTPDQSFFLRENVKLRLLNARLSILSRQFDLAQADLQQAQTALDRYFDHGSRRVVAVSDLLRQVSAQAKQVSFPRPDDTLAAIAAAVAGH